MAELLTWYTVDELVDLAEKRDPLSETPISGEPAAMSTGCAMAH
jgi:hypothetical protein